MIPLSGGHPKNIKHRAPENYMKGMGRRAQSYSVDVVLAIVIFGFVSIAVTSFALLSKPDVQDLQDSAQRVSQRLEAQYQDCGVVLENSSINTVNTQCLFGKNYETFKEDNNIDHDFCIYFEDEQGQIVQIGGINAWGNSDLVVGNTPCQSV